MSQPAAAARVDRSRVTARETAAASTTMSVTRSVVIMRPVAEVYTYVSDFSLAAAWRTEVSQSSQEPPPPMRPGTHLFETASIMGRTVVTECLVDEVEPGRRFTFHSVSGPIPVSGEYQTDRVALGTTVTYTLNAELRGAWRWFAPLLRISGTRTMQRSLEKLRRLLEAGVAQEL